MFDIKVLEIPKLLLSLRDLINETILSLNQQVFSKNHTDFKRISIGIETNNNELTRQLLIIKLFTDHRASKKKQETLVHEMQLVLHRPAIAKISCHMAFYCKYIIRRSWMEFAVHYSRERVDVYGSRSINIVCCHTIFVFVNGNKTEIEFICGLNVFFVPTLRLSL